LEERRRDFKTIEERLRGVETQLAALVAIKKESDGHVLELIFENRKDIDALTNLMNGNGTPEKGIAHRMISLEESRDRSNRHFVALWCLFSGVVIKIFGDFFSKLMK
jgi:hypothetical protein